MQKRIFSLFFNTSFFILLLTSISRIGFAAVYPCNEANLDQAIAISDPSIQFNCGQAAATINISATKTISFNTTLDGQGLVSIVGNNTFGLFNISQAAQVTLTGLRLSTGKADKGGAIFNQGTLTVQQSTLSGNTAVNGGGIYNQSGTVTLSASNLDNNTTTPDPANPAAPAFGGGIHNNGGTVTVKDSTLFGNFANSGGGGVYVFGKTGGTSGTLSVVNSTLANNSSPSFGGGVFSDSGVLSLRNVTLSNNSAETGAAIYNQASLSPGTATFQNTIFFNNLGGLGFLNCGGAVANLVSLGFNLQFPDNSCPGIAVSNPLLDINPANPTGLKNNGGPTPTIAILGSSPALDAGDSSGCKDENGVVLLTDQREGAFVRPVDGNADGTIRCDIGAFEVQAQVLPLCGNTTIDAGELCDDGNQSNADNCLNTCVPAICGDGFLHAGVETCDDGNQINNDGCTNTCALPVCGDGIVQANEQCDDANQINTDDCLNTCLNPTCGDGFVQNGVEACDDGNQNNSDACKNNCSLPSCGDSVVQANEQCDDGNQSNADSCLNTCLNSTCGDGFVQSGVEICDDGNQNNNDGCSNTCQLNFTPPPPPVVTTQCGNLIKEAGEECDDGNQFSNDGCDATCHLATIPTPVTPAPIPGTTPTESPLFLQGSGCSLNKTASAQPKLMGMTAVFLIFCVSVLGMRIKKRSL